MNRDMMATLSNHDWREFRRESKNRSAPLVWRIKQEGERYITEHGQLNGALQTFSDVPGPKGKEDTKAYVNAEDNCKFNVEREIRKKVESGYIEYVDGKPLEESVTSISFDKFLPKSFTGSKPQTDISESALLKIHNSGKAHYTRKYDGQAHTAVKHSWGWEIYTRRVDLASERFPVHIEQLDSLPFDVGTVFVGEIVCFSNGYDGQNDFKATSRICRSDAETARKLVEDGEISEPFYLIFDMLFHNGEDLSDKTYNERSNLWRVIDKPLIKPVRSYNITPETWEEVAKQNNWEGFVVVDGDSVPGDKFYSFDGTARRWKGSHKLKPVQTEDVVVYAAASGSGKRLGKVGALFVKQIDPDTGKFFDCGKVGSGFTEEDIDAFTNLCKSEGIPLLAKDTEAKKIDLESNCNIVIEIEFGERQEGTNKFRFPVFIRIRNDKTSKECFANI